MTGKKLFILVILALLLAWSAVYLPADAATTGNGPPRAFIYRDEYGVPHIYADNLYDLNYAFGYVTAQDRLFQLETYRRASRGELAEVLGPDYLDDDMLIRQEFYTDDERMAHFQALPADIREALEAYRDGINAWIAEVRANPALLPFEYVALGFQPRDWTITDSMAIIDLMVRRFGEAGGAGGNELDNYALWLYLTEAYGLEEGYAIFNDVVWNNDPAAPVTIPPPTAARAQATYALPELPRTDPALVLAARDRFQRVKDHLTELGVPSGLGSYAWAVTPSRTANGYALLLGGPQMGFPTPHIAFEVGLHAPGIDVVGMAFAGAPAVLIGTNEEVAWTSTSGIADQVDVYIETLNPENPRQYWYDGAWRDMESRVEVINVRGADPVEVTVYRTVHGPVFFFDENNGIAMSQRRSHWDREVQTATAFFDFDRASTVEEFGAGVDKIVTSHNFIYADKAGNIAYWQGGLQPIRPAGFDPRLPLPGDGSAEWVGIVPQEEMPFVVNPDQGWLANWNNKPRADWPNGDDADWGAVNRNWSIERLLMEDESMTFDDMNAIAIDIGRHDYRADFLKPFLLAAGEAISPLPEGVPEALETLRTWPNRVDEGEVGATIFERWRTMVRRRVFGDELGPFVDQGFIRDDTADNMLLHALLGADASLPPSRDYFNGEDPNQVLIDALADAVASLTAELGPDMSQWGYDPGTIEFRWQGQLIGSIPWYSRGSYIQIVEMTDPVRGVNILPPGQSGFVGVGPGGVPVFDPHFADQLALAAAWQYKPMHLRNTFSHEVVIPAEVGVTGYVDSWNRLGNYFGSGFLYTGLDSRPKTPRVLHGAFQFDLASWVPADGMITKAQVELTGRTARYTTPEVPATFDLQLLSSQVDDQWASLGYWHIHNAPVEATIPPELTGEEVGAGVVNTFTFTDEQLVALQGRLNGSGRASFRLDGDAAFAYGRYIFGWDGRAEFAPLLRLTYVTYWP